MLWELEREAMIGGRERDRERERGRERKREGEREREKEIIFYLLAIYNSQ